MIKGDFQSYPDHRVNFYGLLAAVNRGSFQSLLSPASAFRIFGKLRVKQS